MDKQRTLFNYFTKSPVIKSPTSDTKNALKTSEQTPKSSKTSLTGSSRSRKSKRSTSFDSDEHQSEKEEEENVEPKSAKKSKRRRIVIASESEDSDEYVPEKDAASSESCDDLDNTVSDDESSEKKSVKKNPAKKLAKSLHLFNNPKSSPNTSKLKSPIIAKSPVSVNGNSKPRTPVTDKKTPKANKNSAADENQSTEVDMKEWFHEKLDWLKEGKIRDKSGKLKSDPDYNSRTLFIPESFKKSLTPAMKQWWDLKVENFDSVLFFKVGKFYELYHMDASVGVKELGLIYMKGDTAHSGFPEIAFGRYSECLVEKGFKVARVEQTETPQMMEERCKKLIKTTKYDKVVAREICQITSKGTKTLTYQDESMGVSNNFLLAICEKRVEEEENASSYGICFVDTSIGKFTLGQFKDDRHGSRLLTLIALYPPVEIIYDRGSLTKKTLQLLNHNLTGITKEALNSHSQFWDSSKVLKFMRDSGYFDEKDDKPEYPDTIMQMLDPDDRLLQTPLKQYELAFQSFGACIWYLKHCCIEDCLLTMKLFEEYKPVDEARNVPTKEPMDFKTNMVLDGATLQNLEIVPLLTNDKTEGTLFGTMDNCSTSFGKRLFRNWLCSPLCNPERITDRLDAIDDLNAIPDVVTEVVSIMSKMPDFERLLSKIHAYGLSRNKEHPETRAIFYDSEIYNKRKICDFLSALEGFKKSSEVVKKFEPHLKDFKSRLLKECVCIGEEMGHFPDLSSSLNYFDQAFNHETAKKQGNISPSPGIDEDYDFAVAQIKKTSKALDEFLSRQSVSLNCKVSYVHAGKNRYLLEVPESKKVPSAFDFQGGRKGYKRYYTKDTRDMLTCLIAAEESRDSALRDVTRRIFSHFDKNYEMWKSAVNCISTLDALISLLLYYKSSGVPMCRPQFSLPGEDTQPHLEIIDGQHPTFLKYFTGDDYIPNSVYIGNKRVTELENINNGGKLVLVTGPNMGGKSTLLRQAGTLVIMAHLGSYVPAESIKLTPVDRIFTRVGANDQISKGESTFFVEASETSSILHHATANSFVLVDELGRGTATFDGTAIAYATLDYLANDIGCRTLFSTHYHSLVEDFREHPHVGLGHMACMVEKDTDCSALEKITFLYKFIDGDCPKSYGFNVALLAGVSKEIVQQGFKKAQDLEYSTRISKVLRNLLSVKTPEEIVSEVMEKLQLT